MKLFVFALTLILMPTAVLAGYDRDSWPHWLDYDGDCINERHEVLIRESVAPVKMTTNGCAVAKGAWVSPYTGERIYRPRALDIDHLVPLAHAYYNGARNWSTEKKAQFANDPLNLVAVDSKSNREKSASGPSVWRPANKGYWCEYATRWQQVKAKYELTSTRNEQDALTEMLTTCQSPARQPPEVTNPFSVTDVEGLLGSGHAAKADKPTCGEKRLCSQMTTCEEAKFHLNQCGLSRLDGDGNGTPCESICQ